MKIFYTLFFILFFHFAHSQDLLKSPRNSPYTFIYKVTQKEARKIQRKGTYIVDTSFFHTKIDSIPTNQVDDIRLDTGNYLKVSAVDGSLKIEFASILPIEPKILDNDQDLLIRLYDRNGNVVKDAKVKVGLKKLRFDKKSQAFREKKSNRKGILQIQYNGLTGYYTLDRKFNRPTFLGTVNKILYFIPVRLVWKPVRFVVMLPIDGVKSIRSGYPSGTIGKSWSVIENSFNRVACLFDDWYCNDDRNALKHYTALNKPKYKPSDTVFYKVYITKKNGTPYRHPIQPELRLNYSKKIVFDMIESYSPGGYSGFIVLNDSLNLTLDNTYDLSFRTQSGRRMYGKSFSYEDYLLKDLNVELELKAANHFSSTKQSLHIKTFDNNDLPIFNGNVKVKIRSSTPDKLNVPKLHVPEILFEKEIDLDDSGETELSIPNHIFPDSPMEYLIEAQVSTIDNLSKTEKTSGYWLNYQTILQAEYLDEEDSVLFYALRNNDTLSTKAQIFRLDHFENVSDMEDVILPLKRKVEEWVFGYKVQTDSLESRLTLDSNEPGYTVSTSRTLDSIYVSVNSSFNRKFTYFIYHTNKEIDRGNTTVLNKSYKARNLDNYYMTLQYLWAGKVHSKNYLIELDETKVNIEVDQPALIYPGQEEEITIRLTDYTGKPLKGVDVTAYSTTSKIDHSLPYLPKVKVEKDGKVILNSFSLENKELNTSYQELNYAIWQPLLGLDSIAYYNFLYPGDSIFKSVVTPKNGITQLSPYVIEKGKMKEVGLILIDRLPVYFGWTDKVGPYSFRVKPGYHRVEVRTKSKKYILDSLYVPAGKRLLFSFSSELKSKHFRAYELDGLLTKQERSTYGKYLFPINSAWKGTKMAHITQGNKIFLLRDYSLFANQDLFGPRDKWYFTSNYSTNSNNWRGVIGPIYPNDVRFVLEDGYELGFTHESGYQYRFKEKYLKLTTADWVFKVPNASSRFKASNETTFSEFVMNDKDIENFIQYKKFLFRYWHNRFNYAPKKEVEYGSIYLWPNTLSDTIKVAINHLLFKLDDPEFLRVYPGVEMNISHLEKGNYRLIELYANKSYRILDSLNVKEKNTLYLKTNQGKVHDADTFSLNLSRILNDSFKNLNRGSDYYMVESVRPSYFERFNYSGPGRTITGIIQDEYGAPIVGASILVKGTTYGAITDGNGYYSVRVPSESKILAISYIGFSTQEIVITAQQRVNVILEADVTMLSEVVVTGFGGRTRSNLTGSVASVDKALQGRASGVQITSASGLLGAGMAFKVRGVSSVDAEKKPLIVIDGIIVSDLAGVNPAFIKSSMLLKGNAATSLYGSRAAEGVLILSTKGEINLSDLTEPIGNQVLPVLQSSDGHDIRTNFKDYSFWQPRLITDQNGEASFTVTFPDDITEWETFFIAQKNLDYSGTYTGKIKSYKPLMARIYAPEFLVDGDTLVATGQLSNVGTDSVKVRRTFHVDQIEQLNNTIRLAKSKTDSLYLIAHNQDTLQMQYIVETTDGYKDGEKRFLPIRSKGIEKWDGKLWVLDQDTSFQYTPSLKGDELILRASTSYTDFYKSATKYLVNYRFGCNEQLASRLVGHITANKYEFELGKNIDHEKEIKRLISRLLKNRNSEGLWSWWGSSYTSSWTSNHVISALNFARSEGYDVDLKWNKANKMDEIIFQLESSKSRDRIMDLLDIIKEIDPKLSVTRYHKKLDTLFHNTDKLYSSYIRYLGMSEIITEEEKLEAINRFKKSDIYGFTYFASQDSIQSFKENELQLTLDVFSILSAMSNTNKELIKSTRNYIITNLFQVNRYNTYNHSRIIMALENNQEVNTLNGENKITITGDTDLVINTSRAEKILDHSGSYTITKTGDLPAILSLTQSYFDTVATQSSDHFLVTTEWENHSTENFEAGEEYTLVVTVNNKKKSDYVLINIPIPSSFTYVDKPQYRNTETHREYFKEQVSIYLENYKEGIYTYKVKLKPRFSGSFTMNPTSAELMYFPLFKDHESVKRVQVLR